MRTICTVQHEKVTFFFTIYLYVVRLIMAYCYFVLHWLTLSPLQFRMVKLVTGVSKLCITWLSRPSNMASISYMYLSGTPSDLQSSSIRSLSSCTPSVESITRVVRHFSVQRRAGLEAGGKRLSCTLRHTTSLFAYKQCAASAPLYCSIIMGCQAIVRGTQKLYVARVRHSYCAHMTYDRISGYDHEIRQWHNKLTANACKHTAGVCFT